MNKEIFAGSLRPETISWCAQVTVAPDKSKINVFNKGTPHGLKGLILTGGHIEPISIAGDKLEWKKAQKKAKKNITSETMKRSIPLRNPHWTVLVWYPLKVASRITSLHHIAIEDITDINPNNKIISPYIKECIYIAAPVTVRNDDIAETIGHGLGSTKWKGCVWIELWFIFVLKINKEYKIII